MKTAPSALHRARNLLLLCGAIGLASIAPMAGCQRGGVSDVPVFSAIGGPSATIENGSTVPLRMTLWLADRRGEYAETWKTMTGRTETVRPGDRARFTLRDYPAINDPILRLQVETRGPSFLPTHSVWYEIVTAPSFSLRIFGSPEELQARSTQARFVRIPDDRVLTPGRTPVIAGAGINDATSQQTTP